MVDLEIEAHEIAEAEEIRRRHGLSLDVVRAVHACVFAEYLMAFASDRELDADEEEQLEWLANCLEELGWRPA